jgi:hypothetical protein
MKTTKKVWKTGTGLVILIDKLMQDKLKIKSGDIVEVDIKKI